MKPSLRRLRIHPRKSEAKGDDRISRKKRVALTVAAGAMVAVPVTKDALPPYDLPDTARQTDGLLTNVFGVEVSKKWCDYATGFALDPDRAFRVRLTPEGLICGHQTNESLPENLPETVSGGEGSVAPWGELGSKGRQFLSETTRASDLAEIYPNAELKQDAIRAYVGIHHAKIQDGRAQGAALFSELKRLGAFDRAFLHIAGTTGSGLSNRVTLGALEAQTRADIATGGIQVNDSRSIYSAWQVEEGRAAYHELFKLLRAEFAEREAAGLSVPQMFVTGESLGAQLVTEGMLEFDEGLVPDGFGPVLLFGTPGDCAWFKEIQKLSETERQAQGIALISSLEELETLPEETKVVVFNNVDDPVVQFKMEANPRFIDSLKDTLAAAKVGKSLALEGHEYRVATPRVLQLFLEKFGVTVKEPKYAAIMEKLLTREGY